MATATYIQTVAVGGARTQEAVLKRLLSATTIVLSSTLLFLIQPMMGKELLPLFGGAAGVWATCVVFFECLLLLGYLYAHISTRFLGKLQFPTHVLLLSVSALTILSIGTLENSPGTADPAYGCFVMLARRIGLPYFVLSSTSPLVQAWFARTTRGGIPYRLFALSNLGSLLALLAYPFAFERFMDLSQQFHLWRAGYFAFAIVLGAFAVWAYCNRVESKRPAANIVVSGTGNWQRIFTWIALAGCSSALFLGVTTALCQNIAPVPLLWVAPLAVYLLSFVFCFDHENLFKPALYRVLLPPSLVALLWFTSVGSGPLWVAISACMLALFIACMFCHGQLSALKPASENLTSFYLCVSLGGALGGTFVGLIAPTIFVDFFELNLAIVACLLLSLRFLYGYRSKPALFALGVVAIVSFRAVAGTDGLGGTRTFSARNFYGALSTRDYVDSAGNKGRSLFHGRTAHGDQLFDDRKKLEPTSYYGRESGAGLALSRPLNGPQRVGIVGLGAGTLAAYGRLGDYYRFYEINPMVVELARSHFTFLKDSKAHNEVAIGDARLVLQSELDQHFDTLVLDAFSGDSIPIHLLTYEAFQCYFRHLKQNGVIAIHISNQYLDLRGVAASMASRFHARALEVASKARPELDIRVAEWVLISTNDQLLDQIQKTAWRGTAIPPSRQRLWTDQYSSVISVLR